MCEEANNPCLSDPCLNGGICLSDEADSDLYTCDCSDTDYEGDNCEEPVQPCASSPCPTDSTCIEDGFTFNCDCPAGYEDLSSTCCGDISEYPGSVYALDSYQSNYCSEAYMTENCWSNVSEETIAQCLVCETCYEACGLFSDHRYCAVDCGADCEDNVDECASSPCSNGATCIDGVLSFECVCAAGYTDVGTECCEIFDSYYTQEIYLTEYCTQDYVEQNCANGEDDMYCVVCTTCYNECGVYSDLRSCAAAVDCPAIKVT